LNHRFGGSRAIGRSTVAAAIVAVVVAGFLLAFSGNTSLGNAVTDFFTLAVAVSVPYILGGQGMTLAGRTGIFLVFNEGVMLCAASATFLATYLSGGNILIGLLAGALMAGLFGLVMGFFSVTLQQDQFIVGLALFVAAVGIANFLYSIFVGVTTAPPLIPVLKPIHVPLLSDLPFFGSVLFSQNLMFYFAVALSVGLWYFLYRTRYGLNLRSVGENPRVADSNGISVTRMRYAATIIGSMIMGLGGAYLPLYFTATYTPSLVSGRGWIVIALTLFGRWSPLTVMLGALVFAGAEVFGTYSLILSLPVPDQFLLMVPFIVTLVILIISYRRAELPQALGKAYDRESVED
jgi:ABC-type uncharacterized transport system permease subunit